MNYDEVVSRAKVPEKFSVVGRSGITSNASDVMIENTPITGIKIDLGYGTFDSPKNVKVMDPRGFEVSLPLEGILQMLLTVNIRDGEVREECVWSFLTPLQPRLLPVSSIVYQTITNPCKLTPRNLKIGDVVRLIGYNRSAMTYLGKFYAAKTDSWYYSSSNTFFTDKTHHVFIDSSDNLHISMSPKIFSLDGNTDKYSHLTVADLNKKIVNMSGCYSGNSMVLRITADKKAQLISIPKDVPAPLDLCIIRNRSGSKPVTVEFEDGVTKDISSYNLPNYNQFFREFSQTYGRTTYTGMDVKNFYYDRYAIENSDGTVDYI